MPRIPKLGFLVSVGTAPYPWVLLSVAPCSPPLSLPDYHPGVGTEPQPKPPTSAVYAGLIWGLPVLDQEATGQMAAYIQHKWIIRRIKRLLRAEVGSMENLSPRPPLYLPFSGPLKKYEES